MKNKFFGIYYKYQSKDGYTIAVISSTSNEGEMIQIITPEGGYIVDDISSVKVSFEEIVFDVHQDDIDITGNIKCSPLLKPKKDIMSYYRYLPIECKHNIYSMHHKLSGSIVINNKTICFDEGDGYIEGDQGRNFPHQYLWFNASNDGIAITVAVATIPLGLISILGITSLIVYKGKEYRFGIYNSAKVKKKSKDEVIIAKGKYVLTINMLEDIDGHKLKAPIKGDMTRYIHECPSLKARIILKKKDELIFDIIHPYASYEYMFDK